MKLYFRVNTVGAKEGKVWLETENRELEMTLTGI